MTSSIIGLKYHVPQPGLALQVRGQNASTYEYNFAVALEMAGFDYLFQIDYFGGRRIAGGFILDFLVFTEPLPTPVWVNGDYWHKGTRQSTLDFLQRNLLRINFASQMAPAVVLWGAETETLAAARIAVKKYLGG